MSVEAVATRAAEKIQPEGVEIFFQAACFTLGAMFLLTKWRNDEDRFTWSV
jgi:hypothetical protein